jgi:hypothetical protein
MNVCVSLCVLPPAKKLSEAKVTVYVPGICVSTLPEGVIAGAARHQVDDTIDVNVE